LNLPVKIVVFRNAFKHDGAALVEALVHRQELPMPATITIEQATGFGTLLSVTSAARPAQFPLSNPRSRPIRLARKIRIF
jgi:hypothetical protein